jgi:CRP-like cAMP-binding protein
MPKTALAHPECQHCESRHKSIFCDLHSDELSELAYAKGCTTYKKGQLIFGEHGWPLGLYCINTGKVKLSQSGADGKDQIIRLAKDGDVLGYRALLSGDRYSNSATALDDSNVCFIPKEVFFKLIEKNASLSLQVMRMLSENLKNAQQRITDMAQKPVRERLAEALLFLKETYGFEEDGITLNVPVSREDLANMAGTATETTIRLLSDYKQEGLLELPGRKIKIINLPKLVKVANIHD